MEQMRNLHEQGLINDAYMESLELAMKERPSMARFEGHLNEMAEKPDFSARGSGGNKSKLTANQRKRKRKAQKKARRATA